MLSLAQNFSRTERLATAYTGLFRHGTNKTRGGKSYVLFLPFLLPLFLLLSQTP